MNYPGWGPGVPQIFILWSEVRVPWVSGSIAGLPLTCRASIHSRWSGSWLKGSPSSRGETGCPLCWILLLTWNIRIPTLGFPLPVSSCALWVFSDPPDGHGYFLLICPHTPTCVSYPRPSPPQTALCSSRSLSTITGDPSSPGWSADP